MTSPKTPHQEETCMSSSVRKGAPNMLAYLPTELILNIAGYLNIHDVYSLIRAARRFHGVLTSRLYELGVDHVSNGSSPVIWAVQNGQMTVLRNLLAKETHSIHAHRGDLIGGTTALHQAVIAKNEEATRLLLQHRAMISVKDGGRQTPLALAAASNNEKLVRMLIEAGAGGSHASGTEWHHAVEQAAFQGYQSIFRLLLEAAGRAGWTPKGSIRSDVLSAVATGGHVGLLQTLCELGWDIRDPTALCNAVESGNLECVRLFIRHGIDVDEEGVTGLAPVLVATEEKQLEILRCLLDAGADHDARDGEWRSALHIAANAADASIVRCLLGAQADVNAEGGDGQTPVHELVLESHDDNAVKEVLDLLLEAGADINKQTKTDETALHLAAQNSASVLKILLGAEADPNIRDVHHNGPLHDAMMGDDFEICQCLIDGGADINMRGFLGQTPLMWAVSHSRGRLIADSIDAGADDSIPNQDGLLLIHEAAKGYRWEILDTLLKKGVDIQARDPHGKTALHYAATQDVPNSITILLQAGAPVDAVTKDGETALHVASAAARSVIAESLLTAGADPMARTNKMVTPLHLAKSSSVAECLINAGADVVAVDDTGHSPLHYAAFRGHVDVVWDLLTTCQAKEVDYLTHCADGRTFIEEAARCGKTDILQVAHAKGVPLNPTSPMADNPPWVPALHEATLHGWYGTVKYLFTHEVDPYRLDMYGRSGLDLATVEDGMATVYARNCDDKVQTNPSEREARLKGTVTRLGTQLLARSESRNFYQLGKCLLFLGDIAAARASFAQTSENSCNMCSTGGLSVDGRYVCLLCDSIDLCTGCLGTYREGKTWHGICKGHEFIEITHADKEVLDEDKARKRWLQDLIERHGA